MSWRGEQLSVWCAGCQGGPEGGGVGGAGPGASRESREGWVLAGSGQQKSSKLPLTVDRGLLPHW